MASGGIKGIHDLILELVRVVCCITFDRTPDAIEMIVELIRGQLFSEPASARLQGRPTKDLKQIAIERYSEELNNGWPRKAPGKSDRNKYYFMRDCWCHLALISMEQANQPLTDGGWHECKICCSGKLRASSYEMLFSLVAALIVPHYKQVLQPRVLCDKGGVDFMLITCHSSGPNTQTRWSHLLVEVDGEQHFEGQHHDHICIGQWERDRKKDEQAIQHGWKLLRLHYKDKESWASDLQRAIRIAETESIRACVLYSHSYSRVLQDTFVQ